MTTDESGLFRAVVARPVAVTMVFLAALVFGYVSYHRLPIELMPDISYPKITVRTAYEGAAPQEVESQISQPVEEALATLDGLVSLESRSRAGNSDVILGFDWGTDMPGAAQSVRESLQTTFLPQDADRPLILRYDPSLEPFMRLALAYGEDAGSGNGEADLLLLREVADRELKRELEGMEGVAAVRVRGGFEREIRVEVREDWLSARRVRLDEVRAVLASENINVAGGSILEGDTEYLVRTLNEYGSVEELTKLEVRRSDGVLVPITDVATIRETHKERTVLSHLRGNEAVELEVFKEADANVVEVADRVRKKLMGGDDVGFTQADVDEMPEAYREPMQALLDGQKKAIAATLPAGVDIAILDDTASFIDLAVSNLRSAVVVGGFFAVFVLFLFLRDFRATAIIGISIPVSVVCGFAPLYLWGVSLNLMSLGGLALGVGMLVDNAVVVLESIQRNHESGLSRIEAAVKGVGEVSAAVVASTLTTVAVFAPIAFVEGIGGELFGDLSMAVVGSLLASLVVALFLVPTLAALSLDLSSAARADEDSVLSPRALLAAPFAQFAAWRSWSAGSKLRLLTAPWAALRALGQIVLVLFVAVLGVVVFSGGRVGLTVGGYLMRPVAGLLMGIAGLFQRVYDRGAQRYGRAMRPILERSGMVVGVAALLFALSIQGLGMLGSELLPVVHQGRFVVEAALPVGTPLSRTARVITEAERIVGSHPEVEVVYTTIGSDQRADASSDEGEHTARLRVQLTPGGDVAAREDAVMEDLRRELALELGDLSVNMSRPSLFSFRTPLEVVVYGSDLDVLRSTGARVAAAVGEVPGVRDVRSSLVAGNPEIQIAYDRERLSRFGLDTATVAARVRDKVKGIEATKIHRGDQRLDLLVQLDPQQRGSLDDLRALNVNPNLMPAVPLEAVAWFTDAIGPSEIRRVDQQRAVVVSANLEGFDLGSAVAGIKRVMRTVQLDDGVFWVLGGQAREMGSSMESMRFALGLAIFLVYVIMASTFEHLVHPFVILFSVPLAAVGVTAGLMLWGLPLSVVAFIGMIVLAGVVVNNAIVLVDAINRLRAEGMERTMAIREAAALRLRPILITTATTVLGLAPLVVGFGAGAEVQAPLAVTVISGLTASTLLTLVVIPAVYALFTTSLSAEPAPLAEGEVAK